MGFQMAARLQQHLRKHGEGRRLIAWNRTLSKADFLTEQGALTVQHAAGRSCTIPCPLHQPLCFKRHAYHGAQRAALMLPCR